MGRITRHLFKIHLYLPVLILHVSHLKSCRIKEERAVGLKSFSERSFSATANGGKSLKSGLSFSLLGKLHQSTRCIWNLLTVNVMTVLHSSDFSSYLLMD